MKFSLVEDNKTHLKSCDVCLKAKTSDEMCRYMQRYFNNDCTPSRRESLLKKPHDIENIAIVDEPKAPEAIKPTPKINIPLDTLSFRRQECIRLYYYEDLSIRKTAKYLGIGKSSVHEALQGALEQLREIMSTPTGHFSDNRGENMQIVQVFEFMNKNYRMTFSPSPNVDRKVKAAF